MCDTFLYSYYKYVVEYIIKLQLFLLVISWAMSNNISDTQGYMCCLKTAEIDIK